MIGILDSGLGGLDLARRLMDRLPASRLIYFGDTAHGPYDEKGSESILRHALRGARFLQEKGARRIVIACHTISSAASEALAAQLTAPVIDVVAPAAAGAVRGSSGRRIGVAAARATLWSDAYEKHIRMTAPDAAVYTVPCPLIGPLIEEGWLKKPETTMIVKKYLSPLKVRKIDTLILGDARYPVLATIFQRKIGRRVRLVDGASELLPRLVEDGAFSISDTATGPSEHHTAFYLSDVTPDTERRAAIYLKRRVPFHRITL